MSFGASSPGGWRVGGWGKFVFGCLLKKSALTFAPQLSYMSVSHNCHLFILFFFFFLASQESWPSSFSTLLICFSGSSGLFFITFFQSGF